MFRSAGSSCAVVRSQASAPATWALALIACAGLAWPVAPSLAAGMSDPEPAPQAQPEPADDLLSGPNVDDVDMPGKGRAFGEGMGENRRDRGMAMREFMGVIRALSAPDVPAELAATDEQKNAVQAIAKEFQQARKDHLAANQEKIDELRAHLPQGKGQQGQRGQRGRGGPEGGAGEGMPPPPQDGGAGQRAGGKRPELTPEQKAAADQLKQIMAAGPKPEEYQARVWEVLSPEQRAFAEKKMAEQQAQRRERAEEALRNRQNGEGGQRPPQGQRRPRPAQAD
jgi:hypothetical protein